jgi:hypothetical protein
MIAVVEIQADSTYKEVVVLIGNLEDTGSDVKDQLQDDKITKIKNKRKKLNLINKRYQKYIYIIVI